MGDSDKLLRSFAQENTSCFLSLHSLRELRAGFATLGFHPSTKKDRT